MHAFLTELKRRHVYRVAVLYAAAAWVTVQIADIILENFNVAEEVMQLLIMAAALGLPIALALAWVYDAGAKDSAPEEAEESPRVTSPRERPGIAVLPFDNFSEDPLGAATCQGFTADLTTQLARIPGFFVISRNSAYACREKHQDTRSIAADLGVRYLLEGSLRPLGGLVRVTAQLIEASTGSHLWADHYDTPADELTQIQDALIDGIALQLGVELARAEFDAAQQRLPNDVSAWSLYQQARGTMMFMGWSEDSLRKAISQLEEALKLDPEYAPAHGYLALLLALGHWIRLVDEPAQAHQQALAAAETALALAPNSPEVLGYVGCAYSDLGYKLRGIPLIERAIELDPSNAQARAALGAAKFMAGNLEVGMADLAAAVKLSPCDPGLALWACMLTVGSGYQNKWEEAEQWAELAYKSDARFFPGLIAYAWVHAERGRLKDAQSILDDAKKLFPAMDEAYINSLLGQGVLAGLREAGITMNN